MMAQSAAAAVLDEQDAEAVWADATLAAALLAIDPSGLGGIEVRSRSGPVRDAWSLQFRAMFGADRPVRRLPAGVGHDRLIGGIDLAETLRSEKLVASEGLLAEAEGGVVEIPMAERLPVGTAALIATAMDASQVSTQTDGFGRRLSDRIGLVMYDEGSCDDEQVPSVLASRSAFRIDLDGLRYRVCEPAITPEDVMAARDRLPRVRGISDEILTALVSTAEALGVAGVLPCILAMRTATAAAALDGRDTVDEDDAAVAARLVFAHRATRSPVRADPDEDQQTDEGPGDQPDASDTSSEPKEDAEESDRDSTSMTQQQVVDMLLAAVEAALPAGLLFKAKSHVKRNTVKGQGSGSGSPQRSLLRGRPKDARLGRLGNGARLALVDTLRAAAPWQSVRRRGSLTPASTGIIIRPDDMRIKTFVVRRESTVIFCVDASGSSAFARLAEAKGAVELLLGEAYAARTYAALVCFRGERAEVILPPTRSVARARALLAEMPGGGGTPLASGLDEALKLALGERARGRDPQIVLLTDGKANIARDGTTSRSRASDDVAEAAQQIAVAGVPTVFIDTSPRSRAGSADLADRLGATYVVLPFLDANAVRDAVQAILPFKSR